MSDLVGGFQLPCPALRFVQQALLVQGLGYLIHYGPSRGELILTPGLGFIATEARHANHLAVQLNGDGHRRTWSAFDRRVPFENSPGHGRQPGVSRWTILVAKAIVTPPVGCSCCVAIPLLLQVAALDGKELLQRRCQLQPPPFHLCTCPFLICHHGPQVTHHPVNTNRKLGEHVYAFTLRRNGDLYIEISRGHGLYNTQQIVYLGFNGLLVFFQRCFVHAQPLGPS